MNINNYGINRHIAYRSIEGETLILDVPRHFYYKLCGTGSEIWDLIVQGKNLSEIISILSTKYNHIEPEKIKNDVENFVRQVIQLKFIKERR